MPASEDGSALKNSWTQNGPFALVGHVINFRSSLSFFLVRRAKRERHANDHARDWRRETGKARKKRDYLQSQRECSSDFLAWKLKCWQAKHVKRDLRIRLRAVSLFFFFLLGLPPSFLASRGFAAQRSCARALPSLNLKKKRDRSQSSKHENSSLLKNFVSTTWKSILKSGNPYICSHIS